MDYAKIKTDGNIQLMGNPVRITISNPSEEQKATAAVLTGDKPVRYTDPPEYDPETEYITDQGLWQYEDGYCVQHWEVKPIDPPEPEEEIQNE